MVIEQVTIQAFRNLRHVAFGPSPALTLLVGRNGQGKTNILEAIYLLLQGHSYRTRQEQEMVPTGGGDVFLEARIRTGERVNTVRYVLPPQGRHTWHGERLPVVIFSPDDLALTKAGPAYRRAFMDLLLSSTDARYARSLRTYHRALLQRNRALKDPAYRHLAADFLPILTQEGIYLWNRRYQVFDALMPRAKVLYERLADGECISADYATGGTGDRVTTMDEYLKAIDQRRSDEHQRQMTLVGPHRDDIKFFIEGRLAATCGSQGQHRTIAVALKLATYQWLKEQSGQTPLVLLDDVLSELDESRREALLYQVSVDGAQTIVTDTEPRSYATLRPLILTVEKGDISPWNGHLEKNPFAVS